MKRKTTLLYNIIALLIAIIILSCSEKTDLLTDKYWVKHRRIKSDYLVKFESDGHYLNYNKLEESFTYEIIHNRLIFTEENGVKDKYFIKTLSENELVLSKISETDKVKITNYYKAEVGHYFFGDWLDNNPKKILMMSFDKDGNVKLQENIDDYKAKKTIRYSVKKNNIVFIDGEEYQFNFSDDLMELELISNDGSKIKLIRKK